MLTRLLHIRISVACAIVALICGPSISIAQPQFFFDALPELPGGASSVFYVNDDDVLGITTSVGQALDGDGINKAVVWTKPAGQPWEIEVLPNPFGNTESVAFTCACVTTNEPATICWSAGSANDQNGNPQPILWTGDGTGPWTAEILPLPPGYDFGVTLSPASDKVVTVDFSGWVDLSIDLEPHRAAVWTKDLDSGLWTVQLLPDTGLGFSSEAHVIFVDPGDGRRTIGGTAQNIEGDLVPVVWEETAGGGFNMLELLMLPGGTYGAVNSGGRRTAPIVSTVLAGDSGTLAGVQHGVLWRHNAGLWQAPVDLGTLPGYLQSTVTGVGFGFDPDDLCLVGSSHNGPGTERATLWEVAADNTVTRYDFNDRTVNLPAGVTLDTAFAGPQALDDDPAPLMIFVGGFRNSGNPANPHANVLVLLSGEDCNLNGEDDAIDLYSGTSADVNGNHQPDECEPKFTFEALPEPPGGASEAFGSFFHPGSEPFGWWLTVGRVQQALCGVGGCLWQAVVWTKPAGQVWQLEVLPNPFGNTASAAYCTAGVTNFQDAYCLGGYANNDPPRVCVGGPDNGIPCTGFGDECPEGTCPSTAAPQPVVWTGDGVGPWTAELPPVPPPYVSGAIAGMDKAQLVDLILKNRATGWVSQASGERHAAFWTKDVNGQWSVGLLPDNGPGLPSEGLRITHDNIFIDDVHIGGASATPSSPKVPSVWQSLPGGGFERTDLPMTPGAYLGTVNRIIPCDTFVEFCAVGYNATPGGIDFYKPVVYRRIAGVWGAPLELLPLPGMRDARPGGVVVGTSNSPGGLTVVGRSYDLFGNDRATLWEVAPNNAITMYDLNSQTVNLPPGVTLQAPNIPGYRLPGWTGLSVAGTFTMDSPLAGPVSAPHAYVLSSFAPPLAAPAPHDRRKNRYVSFVPNSGLGSVAFEIDKTTAPTGSCWVNTPDASSNAKCVASPVFRVWIEPVVHVGDCEIMPVAQYEIRASADGSVFTAPQVVNTIAEPALNLKKWGDNVGSNNGSEWTPPNQITNVNDVLSLLANISGAAIRPHFTVANLQAISAADPCLNAFVNTADVLIVVKATAGDAFPFTTNPANCPICP